MKKFIDASDLDQEMAPSNKWMDMNKFEGILFIEFPGEDEFKELIARLPEQPKNFDVAHCQFNGELSYRTYEDMSATFFGIFNYSYEEVFVRIKLSTTNLVLWLPSNHKFYVLFGDKKILKSIKNLDLYELRQTAISFSQEPFFTRTDRDYISKSINTYFTFKD